MQELYGYTIGQEVAITEAYENGMVGIGIIIGPCRDPENKGKIRVGIEGTELFCGPERLEDATTYFKRVYNYR